MGEYTLTKQEKTWYTHENPVTTCIIDKSSAVKRIDNMTLWNLLNFLHG